MSRIFIDFERIKNPYCGLGQYSIALGNSLLAIKPDDIELTYFIPEQARMYFNGPIHINPVSSIKKNPFNLLGLFMPANIDLWHISNQDSDYFPFHSQGTKLLTIHDLNFLHVGSASRKQRRIRKLRKKIAASHHISTISNFVKQELLDIFNLSSNDVTVIYNGVIEDQALASSRPAHVPDDFYFTIGQVVEKKNFHTLVDMMRHLPDKSLVIAGQNDNDYARAMRQRIRDNRLQDRVHLVGAVSDAEKNWLYEHCEAFLFPSLAEGFGMPPIEAMRMGKPVVLSRATSLPEIAGEHAYYWNNFNPAEMAETVIQAIHDFITNDRKEATIQHGLSYNWETAAREYLSLYQKLLSNLALPPINL